MNAFSIAAASIRVIKVLEINQLTLTSGLSVLTLLVELFWNCFFGQFLITSSENLANAAYDCGWERWDDPSMRKTVSVVLKMAQKHSRLTTGFKEIGMPYFFDVIFKMIPLTKLDIFLKTFLI